MITIRYSGSFKEHIGQFVKVVVVDHEYYFKISDSRWLVKESKVNQRSTDLSPIVGLNYRYWKVSAEESDPVSVEIFVNAFRRRDNISREQLVYESIDQFPPKIKFEPTISFWV